MPLPSASWLRLTPFLARSVGFLPVFSPPEGRLGHAPVHGQPGPVNAPQAVVLQQAHPPHLQEDAVAHPLLEAVVGGRAGAEAGGVEGLPLAAGAQAVEDGVHADAVGHARAAAAEAVGVLVAGDAQLDLGPQLVGDAPGVGDRLLGHGRASPVRAGRVQGGGGRTGPL